MRVQFLQIISFTTCLFTLASSAGVLGHLRRRPYSPIQHVRDVSAPETGTIALRQHHAPRALLDICANIDADVLANLNLLGIPLGAFADLDICLCLSMFPLVLTADVDLAALVSLFGADLLTAILTAAINEAPGSRQCTYPHHSKPVCSSDNPCGWQCNFPYVADGDQCVCPPSLSTCNGVCGSFPHGCGSATPYARSLRADAYMERRIDTAIGITTLADAQRTCSEHETICGVYGGSARGFECLDLNTQLESCGGCMVPNPFLPAMNGSVVGVDCTTIPGVASVSCVARRCVVTSCEDGWVVGEGGNTCVEVDVDATVADLVQADVSAGVGLLVSRMLKKRRSGTGALSPEKRDLLDVVASLELGINL